MKKILIVIGIIIALLIASIILLPIIFKDKIVAKVKTEINNNVNAKADFKSFDLTLLSSFPDFTFTLNDFSIIGIKEFEGDTLTNIKQFSVTVDLMSVIKGSQLTIKAINLKQPFFNLYVLKDGKANWDIAKPSTDTTKAAESSSAFKVTLKKYAIAKGRIIYNDESLGFKITMDDLDHTGNGDFTQDLFTLSTMTIASATNMWYGGVKYLHNVQTDLKADLEMDMKNMKFTFKENELKLNALAIGFNGWLAMPADDISMDLTFAAKQNEFRNFISMIPGIYSDSFKDLQSKGSLAFRGFVKGIYNDAKMPGFGLVLNVKDGMFRYPSLPMAVNNVQIDLNITNPDGVPDHTTIDLNRMHAELGTDAFDVRLLVRTPVSDADLNGMLKGRVNLSNIGKMVPLEQGTSIKGLLLSDVSFNGRMSAIQQKKYEDFNADGSLTISDFNYTSKDYKQGFDLKQCALTFNPKNVTLNNLDARMGKSDFKASGTLENFLPYIFKDEVLTGALTLQSNQIDLNEFTGDPTTNQPAAADTAAMQMVEVPSNIDFVLNSSIGKIVYDDLQLANVKGSIKIKNATVDMSNLSFNTLGGSIMMNGSYATPTKKNADINFALNITDCDIQKTVKTFNTVKKISPIAERCNGIYSTSLTINGKLDQQMNPVMNTLNGSGKLRTGNVTVTNFTPLTKLAEALKMDQFKQIGLSNIDLSFDFMDGRIYIKPFETSLAGYKTKIEGSNGFDQTIDYKLNLEIPTSQLPSAATSVIKGLVSQANSKGANLSLGDKVNVNVMMGGTVEHPEIKTGLKEASGKIGDQLKDKAKEELDKKKKELEDKAKSEADRLKKEAEDKAKSEADRLKKEAEAKAKTELEKAKKDLENKTKDALKNVFKKPK